MDPEQGDEVGVARGQIVCWGGSMRAPLTLS